MVGGRGVAVQPAPLEISSATLPAQLLRHATTRGDQAAFHVIAGDRLTTLSWAELLRQAHAYAGRYRAAGVVPGDVVLISLKHGPWLYPAYLGAMLAGAAPAFLPFPRDKQGPVLNWETHQALFARLQARVLLTYAEHAADVAGVLPAVTMLLVNKPLAAAATPIVEIAAALAPPDPDSVALIQHSSG